MWRGFYFGTGSFSNPLSCAATRVAAPRGGPGWGSRIDFRSLILRTTRVHILRRQLLFFEDLDDLPRFFTVTFGNESS